MAGKPARRITLSVADFGDAPRAIPIASMDPLMVVQVVVHTPRSYRSIRYSQKYSRTSRLRQSCQPQNLRNGATPQPSRPTARICALESAAYSTSS
jgi:hypothetical protein